MKWKNNGTTKLIGGFVGDVRAYDAINENAEVLQECQEHIKRLEKMVEILSKYNPELADMIKQLKEQDDEY